MTYYHGRSKSRPFFGNHIYVTPSPEYALRYSDDGMVFECEIQCSEKEIFCLSNPDHKSLILEHFGSEVFAKIKDEPLLDWSYLTYLSSDKFDVAEDFFRSLNFKALRLKEQQSFISLYVLDQENVYLGKKIKI